MIIYLQRNLKVILLGAFSLAPGALAPAAFAAGTEQPLALTYSWVPKSGSSEFASALTPAEKRQLARQLSNKGSGSYICSPSGSGSRPSCFARR